MPTPQNIPDIDIRKACEALQQFMQAIIGSDQCHMTSTLRPILHEEFDKADPLDTKHNIQKRVLHKAAKALDLCPIEKSSSSCMVINEHVMSMFDDLFRRTQSNDVKLNILNAKYTAFKNQDNHDLVAVRNIIREFQKDNEIAKENCTNKREKILKNNELNIILAVDGLQGLQPANLVNYIGNLSIGNVANNVNEQHVVVVREMYGLFPELVTGTDCAHFLAMILLQLYSPFINDLNFQLIVKNEIEAIKDYLFKQSEHFTVIQNILKESFVDKMKEVYCANVNNEKLPELANEKVTKFVTHLSKQKNEKRKNETAAASSSTKPSKKSKQ